MEHEGVDLLVKKLYELEDMVDESNEAFADGEDKEANQYFNDATRVLLQLSDSPLLEDLEIDGKSAKRYFDDGYDDAYNVWERERTTQNKNQAVYVSKVVVK